MQGEVSAVAVDVLSEQGDFGDSRGGKLADFGCEFTKRTAYFGAAHGGHNAKGAAVVAANLNCDPGAVVVFTAHR